MYYVFVFFLIEKAFWPFKPYLLGHKSALYEKSIVQLRAFFSTDLRSCEPPLVTARAIARPKLGSAEYVRTYVCIIKFAPHPRPSHLL